MKRITPQQAIASLHAAAARLSRPAKFMEVCGTHTVNAFRSGLHALLPENVELVSGPGCPVCVTAQGEIDQMIELAGRREVTLCTYGDMLHVRGRDGSLADARADGADVAIVYSALDAVQRAADQPDRQVVFAAVGFETTAPATAVAVREAAQRELANFSVLTSHKCILPALRALLDSGEVRVDGFVLPGHVAVITGYDLFTPIVADYRLPCVVTGFEGEQIVAALARLTEIVADESVALENLYPQAVSGAGNQVALGIIDEIFEPADTCWRGLGDLPASGLRVRAQFAAFDARRRLGLPPAENHEPPGCRCGDVITARITPADCPLFATACTPVHAIGPCMVSSEGTCQAWFKFRRTPALVNRKNHLPICEVLSGAAE